MPADNDKDSGWAGAIKAAAAFYDDLKNEEIPGTHPTWRYVAAFFGAVITWMLGLVVVLLLWFKLGEPIWSWVALSFGGLWTGLLAALAVLFVCVGVPALLAFFVHQSAPEKLSYMGLVRKGGRWPAVLVLLFSAAKYGVG